MKTSYVIVHGLLPHTNRELPDYVAHIVYGEPDVTVTPVGRNFVALVEYEEGCESTAEHTFNRMGSFSFGAQLTYDRQVALSEFGVWVYHYARVNAGTSLEVPA